MKIMFTVTYLGILVVVVLLRANPSSDQVVADSVGQRQKVVTRGGHISVLDQSVVQMTIEAVLDLGNIANCQGKAMTDVKTSAE